MNEVLPPDITATLSPDAFSNMKMTYRIPFEWEEIFAESKGLECTTYRAKVIGGWLIMNNTSSRGKELTQGLVFIPDPDHIWGV